MSGNRDIWTIDPNAPQPPRTIVRVTSDASLHWNPVWAPGGEYLYYGSDRDGTLNLWRVPIRKQTGEVAGPPEPMSLPGSFNGHFSVSQNGDIAYTALTRSFQVAAFPFDGSGPPRTLFGGSQEIAAFEVSPDGRSIAYTTGGAREDVFVANIDGTRVRQFTNDAALDRAVTWSADGKVLYFFSNRNGEYRVWSVRADGSDLTCITDERDLAGTGIYNLYAPAVAPDGRTIAADSNRLTALVHLDRAPGHRVEVVGHVMAPRWSPDGRSLVGIAATADGKPQGVAVYSLETRRAEKLLASGLWPQWLNDGRRVAIFGDDTLRILDTATRTLTTRPFPVPSGVVPRVGPDAAAIYLRRPSSRVTCGCSIHSPTTNDGVGNPVRRDTPPYRFPFRCPSHQREGGCQCGRYEISELISFRSPSARRRLAPAAALPETRALAYLYGRARI
ncbi:MAG TPA: hypothetical protein VNI54_07390 [Thermoanaerobaculia bacterium]|nr:hypothetical protein [Thermoanaerobaculia bacterium]